MSDAPSRGCSTPRRLPSDAPAPTPRAPGVAQPVVAKRIRVYKSGDPHFGGVRVVVNPRAVKTFEALLDSLSGKVPLAFGVRSISTPRGRHGITRLEQLQDGASYLCSPGRQVRPPDPGPARPPPSRAPLAGPPRAPARLLVFRNGDPRTRHAVLLCRRATRTFDALLQHLTDVVRYPVARLYATDGRKVPSLQAVLLSSGAVVAAGREPFKPANYDVQKYLLPARSLGVTPRAFPKGNARPEKRMSTCASSNSKPQTFSVSSGKMNNNDGCSDHSFASENYLALEKEESQNLLIGPSEDDIEKSVIFNQDGTMTVEMKVRFKIKEKETIKWTTTVSRAELPNNDEKSEINSFPGRTGDGSPGFKIAACSLSPVVSPLEKGGNRASSLTEEMKTQVAGQEAEMCSSASWENPAVDAGAIQGTEAQVKRVYRPPTPAPRRVRPKKPLIGSVTVVSETEVQEKMIAQAQGEDKSEYHMFTHSCSKMSSVSSKPVLVQIKADEQVQSTFERKREGGGLESSVVGAGVMGMSRELLELSQLKGCPLAMPGNPAVEEGIIGSMAPDNPGCIKDFKTHGNGDDTFNPVLADATHSSSGNSGVDKAIPETLGPVGFSTVTSTVDRLIQEFEQCSLTTLPKNEKQMSSSVTDQANTRHLQQMKNSNYWNRKIACKKVPSRNDRLSKGGRNIQGTVLSESQSALKGGTLCEGDFHSSDMVIEPNDFCSPNNPNTVNSKNFHKKVLNTIQNPKMQGLLAKRKSKQVSKISFRGSPKIEVGQKDEVFPYKELKYCKSAFENKKLLCAFSFLEHKPNVFCGPLAQADMPSRYSWGMVKKSLVSKVNDSHITLKSQKKKKGDKLKSATTAKNQYAASRSNSLASDRALFPEDTAHNSVQNYIQRWLQNIDPHSSLQLQKSAPVHKKESGFPENNSHASSRKGKQFVIEGKSQRTKTARLVGSNPGEEIGRSFEKHNSEELPEELCESYVGSLTEADLLSLHQRWAWPQSVLDDHSAGSRVSGEKSGPVVNLYQETNLATKGLRVETATQVDLLEGGATRELRSAPLPQQLPVAVPGGHCTQSGIVQLLGSFANVSFPSPLCGPSTNVLLAWLLVLKLRGSMNSIGKGSAHPTADRMSEILALLEVLKHIAVTEEADDLKAAVAKLVESTTNHLGLAEKEQDAVQTDPSESGSSSNVSEVTKCPGNEKAKNISSDEDDSANAGCVLQGYNSDVTCSPGVMDSTNTISSPTETQNPRDVSLPNDGNTLQQASTNKADVPGELCLLPDAGTSQEDYEESHTAKGFCPVGDSHSPTKDCNTVNILNFGENTYLDNSELTQELERDGEIQKDLNSLENCQCGLGFSTVVSHENTNNFSHCDFSLKATKPESHKEQSVESEFQNCSLKKFWDKNARVSFDKEQSTNSEEPGSITNRMTSSERNNIPQWDSSEELENQDSDILCNIRDYLREQVTEESVHQEAEAGKNLELMEIPSRNIAEDIQSGVMYGAITRGLATPPSLMFCYDSKQNTKKQLIEGRTKMKLEMMGGTMEIGSHPEFSPDLATCFKNPMNPDWLVYRQDNEKQQPRKTSSDGPKDPSGVMTQEKEYSKGFVKKTIEKLYGKADVTKPPLLWGSLHRAQVCPDNSLEFPCAEKVSLCDSEGQAFDSSLQISSSSSLLQKSQGERQVACDFNDERANYERDIVEHGAKQDHNNRSPRGAEDGVLIDRGKWLLKENHLLRLSSENSGLYGNADTVSMDTLADNTSNEVPYSHFGNSVPHPSMAELSSELEELIQPLESKCHYFNMPPYSDSETSHQDSASVQNKSFAEERIPNDCAEEKGEPRSERVCTSVTHILTSGNKVHPESDHTVKNQPVPGNNVLPGAFQEGDSLDKLYAICGQHCPILTVIIQPINEEDRGFAYGKVSDIENSLGFHLWMKIGPYLSNSNKNMFRDENNKASKRKSFTDNYISNMFDWFSFNNTFDSMAKREKFRRITFSKFEEENNLKRFQSYLKKKFCVNFLDTALSSVDDVNSMHINKSGSSCQGNEIFEVVDENNNILNNRFQSPGTNLNQIVRENISYHFFFEMLDQGFLFCQVEISLNMGNTNMFKYFIYFRMKIFPLGRVKPMKHRQS